MEENVQPASRNRMTLILLGVVVILLVAIAVILLTGGDDAGSPTASNTGNTGSTNTTGTMPGATSETPFDPATATKVPAGQAPEDYVKTYFDAVVAGDYATAYAMLPTAKQADYGSEAAFSDQLKGYGVTGYTIDSATEEGNEAQVLATATMPGGNFQYMWVFVKDGDVWLVKSRTLPGMSQ